MQINQLVSVWCKQRRGQEPHKHLDQGWVHAMYVENTGLKRVKPKHQGVFRTQSNIYDRVFRQKNCIIDVWKNMLLNMAWKIPAACTFFKPVDTWCIQECLLEVRVTSRASYLLVLCTFNLGLVTVRKVVKPSVFLGLFWHFPEQIFYATPFFVSFWNKWFIF